MIFKMNVKYKNNKQTDLLVSEYSAGNQLYTMGIKPFEGAVPSRIWQAVTTDNASGFGERFAYAYDPNGRGFFETNDYTRSLYDSDPTRAKILNLAGDFAFPPQTRREFALSFSAGQALLGYQDFFPM